MERPVRSVMHLALDRESPFMRIVGQLKVEFG